MTDGLHSADALQEWFTHYIAARTGCDSAEVNLDLPLRDLGLGSIDVLAIPGELSDVLGICVPDLAVWDNPSAHDVIKSVLGGDGSQRSADSDTGCAVLGNGPTNEPIAVIGVACRFSGQVHGVEPLWDFLAEKKSAITEYPARRLGAAAADWLGDEQETIYGCFLEDVEGFDNKFFDIPPDEAALMDPQQRLLLETSWAALEHAGILPKTLKLSHTGVFVGVSSTDYVRLLFPGGRKPTIWDNTGGSSSIIANRLSYFLDVNGPSLVVDTACSSSLVAAHLARKSLASGECDLAVVAGTNVLISPEVWRGFQEAGVVSPTGSCRAFDARADGMVRGEGCGVVVLERLSDARRAGRTVLAVLAGSAVNQDGRSNGIMAPNPRAQISVLDSACKCADIDPAEIDYVEAHGTGTSVGDRIEAHALGQVFGRGRQAAKPLMIGSIKPNIGHLEGAAGIAGLIKTVLMLQRGQLLPSGAFEVPNPNIPFAELGLAVVEEFQEWPAVVGRPRRAGVSSFGFGGTNAHVIVEQAVERVVERVVEVGPGVLAWVVSARTAAGVGAQAGRLLEFVRAGRELDAGDVGYSLVTTRSLFEHRAVVVGADRDELLAGLAEVVEGRPGVGVASGVAMPGGKTVFVFPGQGAQWLGMGRELCAGYPVFGAAFDAVVAELDRHLARPLREVVWGADAELLNTTEFAQPALFAVEVALYRLLESWGMRPGLVMGHSVGELSAAHVSGVLDLADAALLVVMRGRLMQALPDGGAMYAVQAGEQELRPLLGEQVSVAAVNGPGSVVLSGAREAVSVIADRLAAQGRRVRRLAVSHAFHSALMEPMLEQFRAVADEVYAGRPAIPVISNVTGQLVAEDYGSADYWVRHIREAVRFADSVAFAHSAGATRFVEVGPAGGLTSLIEESLAQASVVAVPTLRKDRPEPFAVVGAVAQAFVRGAGVDWASVLAGCGGQRVGLPTYAFAHERFWLADRFGVGQQVCVGQVLADEAGPGAHEAAGAAVGQGFAARLQGLSDAEQQAAVLAMVCEHTAAVLGRDGAAQLDAGQAFSDAGLTSLSAVELRNRLKTLTGVTLSATTAFDYPTPTQLADHLLSHLHHQNRSAPAAAVRTRVRIDEPIAIVGMGCRYPGGISSPAQLWQLVASGGDVIGEFPLDRGWDIERLFDPDPDALGKTYTRHGGFVSDVADFDPGFFGISPGEALAMDPQQRLLLETSWEALEDAGIDPQALRGSATGVFVGIYGDGYGLGTSQAQWYADTGHITSVASGRISYCLGLAGPAISVDTACSSSLVALHLAANSLRAGECDLALAGGSTVLATPSIFIGFSRQRGLATDGRCKAFADAADGTGFSEGAGMLVLQRLSDARRTGQPVLAILAGSAVNQDGASNGLTAPSGPAQQRVISAALSDAGITGADVDVVEAHGTGTRLGDPIEAQALLATYGRDHTPDAPLWLGSIKSNMGHSQAAAGVAGVIKMVEAMRHQLLPATLHIDQPSAHVDWSPGTVQLLTEAREWPAVVGRPRRAGVSSFGVSGTNAHVIVEQAVERVVERVVEVGPGVLAWVVSARTAAGVGAQAGRLLEFVRAGRELDAGDVGYSLVTTRSLFEHRAVVVGADRDELLAGLAEVVEGRPGVGVASGVAMPGGKTVFVFPGQGAQWLGMGRELCAGYPVFGAAFDAVVAELDRHLARPLREVVWGADAELLNTTEFAQPALFAVEVALYRLLESWGMRPGLVMGHSVGELSAAHVSGVLDLADAALLVVMRGRLMQALPDGGAMYAVQAGEQELRPLLGEQVSVAAVNGPGSVVLSGAREAVSVIADRLAAQGRRVRRLAVSHAFHSALMEPMLEQFRAVADEVYAGRPAIPVISNVTGQLVAEDYGSADYWVRHIREAVRFADSVAFAHSAGATRFVEVGPAGGLTSLIEESLAQASVVAVPTLRKDRPEPFAVVGAVAQAFVRGAGVDWASVLAGCGGQRVGLPTYAFAHERFWLADRFGVGQQVCVGQVLADEAGPGAHEAAGAAVGQGFAARLQGLSDAEQQAAVLAMVCEHTAAVLGRDGAAQLDAGQAFSDAGLTSLSAVELRNRLKTLTGVTLSATTAFDYPTPTQLADHLLSHLHHQNPTGATPELDRVDALTDLFLQTCDAGRDDDGWKIVALAANGRERMTTPVPKREWKEVVLLAGGGSDVAVVCLPTLTVLSSPHAYLDVARAMAGRHSVHALSLPGFDPDDALPQDREVVLEGAAQAILHAVGDHPHLVLAGYSSGGVLAHALGSYLAERHQRKPLGVALIDTYLPSQIVNADNPDQVGVNETGALFSRRVTSMARELDQLNATRLTAAASYAALFGTWEPVASAVPLLNMIAMDETAACERVREERINRWRVATAEASYSVVEVPGDHFDMITTSSDATTTALHGWISGLIRAG